MSIIRSLFTAVACLAFALAVAGCTTAQNDKIDAYVQQQLPPICTNHERAKPVVALLVASGKIKGKTADRVAAAQAALDAVCVDPSHQTAASVLTAALTAALTISTAVKQAQAS